MKTAIILLILVISTNCINQVPQVNGYIESLCPDTRDFIVNSYSVFFNKQDTDVLARVSLFPFGNSQVNKDTSGKITFDCQHGPNECYGNRIMTCALNLYELRVSHSLIICLFNQYDSLRPGKITFDDATAKCDSDRAADILKCANSELGIALEVEMANLTPKHTFIPWILVDGKRDDTEANAIRANMLKYLCDQRKGEKLPPCDNSINIESFLKYLD